MEFKTENGEWGTMWRCGHLSITSKPAKLTKGYSAEARNDVEGVDITIRYGQEDLGWFNAEARFAGFFMDDLLRMFKEHQLGLSGKDLVLSVIGSIATAYDFRLSFAIEEQLGAGMSMTEYEYVDLARMEARKKFYDKLIPLL